MVAGAGVTVTPTTMLIRMRCEVVGSDGKGREVDSVTNAAPLSATMLSVALDNPYVLNRQGHPSYAQVTIIQAIVLDSMHKQHEVLSGKEFLDRVSREPESNVYVLALKKQIAGAKRVPVATPPHVDEFPVVIHMASPDAAGPTKSSFGMARRSPSSVALSVGGSSVPITLEPHQVFCVNYSTFGAGSCASGVYNQAGQLIGIHVGGAGSHGASGGVNYFTPLVSQSAAESALSFTGPADLAGVLQVPAIAPAQARAHASYADPRVEAAARDVGLLTKVAYIPAECTAANAEASAAAFCEVRPLSYDSDALAWAARLVYFRIATYIPKDRYIPESSEERAAAITATCSNDKGVGPPFNTLYPHLREKRHVIGDARVGDMLLRVVNRVLDTKSFDNIGLDVWEGIPGATIEELEAWCIDNLPMGFVQKVEVRKLSKAAARTIMPVSMVMFAVCACLFGEFCQSFYSLWHCEGAWTRVGMPGIKGSYNSFASWHAKRAHTYAADGSGFDASLSAIVLTIAGKIVARFFPQAWHAFIQSVVRQHIYCKVMGCFKMQFLKGYGNSSGGYLTSLLNTIVRMIYEQYIVCRAVQDAGYPLSSVTNRWMDAFFAISIFGDDSLTSFDPLPEAIAFNQTSVEAYGKELNFNMKFEGFGVPFGSCHSFLGKTPLNVGGYFVPQSTRLDRAVASRIYGDPTTHVSAFNSLLLEYAYNPEFDQLSRLAEKVTGKRFQGQDYFCGYYHNGPGEGRAGVSLRNVSLTFIVAVVAMLCFLIGAIVPAGMGALTRVSSSAATAPLPRADSGAARPGASARWRFTKAPVVAESRAVAMLEGKEHTRSRRGSVSSAGSVRSVKFKVKAGKPKAKGESRTHGVRAVTPTRGASARFDPPSRAAPKAHAGAGRAESIVSMDAAGSDFLGPKPSVHGDVVSAVVNSMINPWGGWKARLPDNTIVPTCVCTLYANRTYTCPVGASGPNVIFAMNTRMNRASGTPSVDSTTFVRTGGAPTVSAVYTQTPGQILVPMMYGADPENVMAPMDAPSVGATSLAWNDDFGAQVDTVTANCTAYRTLAAAIRIRIIGLPSGQFMTPGKIYVAQIRYDRHDVPLTEQEFVNLEQKGRASHVSADAVREAGSKTVFYTPDGAEKYGMSSQFLLAPGIYRNSDVYPAGLSDSAGIRKFPTLSEIATARAGAVTDGLTFRDAIVPYHSGPASDPTADFRGVSGSGDIANADSTSILIVGYFGITPGVAVEVDYAFLGEFIPNKSAPAGFETAIQLPSASAMDQIMSAAAILSMAKNRLFQAKDDMSLTTGVHGRAPSSEASVSSKRITSLAMLAPGKCMPASEAWSGMDWLRKGYIGSPTSGVAWNFTGK